MLFKQDTIAAIATPPGEGGIAVIRVSGPDALAVGRRVFRAERGEAQADAWAGYTVRYGRFVETMGGQGVNDDLLTSDKRLLPIDDGLLTVFRAPRSYTGEDTIELSCHGGRATTARVLELTLGAGARLAEPGEFTQRAFLNGRMDLAQAEAVADVIRARTESARRLARRQLDGALSQAVTRIKDELIGILAAIEVTIDFSDEVGELDHSAILGRIQAARRDVERLLQTSAKGRILREGLRVAIAGRPNVGKSSLLNALLRAERAIVTPIAGTTRDIVEESASVGGIGVVFVDTAGIHGTTDEVERIGVQRAQSAIGTADIVLLVLDAAAGILPDDVTVAHQIAASECGKMLLVLNKCDLLTPSSRQAAEQSVQADLPAVAGECVFVSAQTGEGLDALEAAIARLAVGETANGAAGGEPDAASVVVAGQRHQQALLDALNSLVEAEQTTRHTLPGDFIAIDARGALDALGLITGETVTDDIIHRIFRDFCVGK